MVKAFFATIFAMTAIWVMLLCQLFYLGVASLTTWMFAEPDQARHEVHPQPADYIQTEMSRGSRLSNVLPPHSLS